MSRPGDQRGARVAIRRGRDRMTDPGARAIAQEVYEASVTLRDMPGDPLPLAIRGPLFAVGARAAQVLAKQFPEVVSSEDDAMDVIAYLTELWCSGLLGFDVGHFEAWRRRTATDGSGGEVVSPPPG